MLSLFPIHRPRFGVSFRAHALELVEIQRGWRKRPVVTRVATRLLPSGLLTPGADHPTMSDPAAVAKELAALLDGVRDRAVAIDVPMACGTLGLQHFETFPAIRTEQEALLRWRLRQEEHLTAPDLALSWHAVSSTASGSTPVSVVSVASRTSILDQYHHVCEAAALIPVSMGWSTVHLLDLVRATFTGTREEVYVAHRTAEPLIVLGVRQGRPIGLRVKPLRPGGIDLNRELLQTLQYFSQDHPVSNHTAARITPCYVMDETVVASGAGATAHPSDTWMVQEHWTVPIVRITWSTAPVVSQVPLPDQPPYGALACVLAS